MKKLTLYSLMLFSSLFLESCNGCSRTRHRDVIPKSKEENDVEVFNNDESYSESSPLMSNSKEVIKMRKEGGVYFVPIEINGVSIEFIFDTGAAIISLSDVEALFLYKQGKLKENDFIGSQQFMDANGDITEGTMVNLRNVKIGNKVIHNIEASIVHNQVAPLLFGQSAMNKFGKITIDYNNNEITFN